MTDTDMIRNPQTADDNSKTYILVRPHFMADHILGALTEDPRYVILPHTRRRSLCAKMLREIRALLPGRHKGLWTKNILPDDYVDKLKEIRPEDKVIFWAVENVKDLKILSAEIDSSRLTSLLWNPVRQVCHRSKRQEREYTRVMDTCGIRACTFDRDDARLLGIDYVGQVYRMPDDTSIAEEDTDIFFIGADKGRTSTLDKLAEKFDSAGIVYDFCILPDRHSRLDRYPRLGKSIISRPLPYAETLKRIRKSRCVLEIVQNGQSGLTLRSLEAMFYGKKLITNLSSVKDEKFYRKENVYILGDESQPWQSIEEFLSSPAVPLSEYGLLDDYDITTWIKRL